MDNWLDYRPTMEILQLIAKIERFHGNWEKNQRLKPAVIKSLVQTSIITSSGSSTRIEGALLSDQEIEELVVKGCQINKISSRSEREVAGYINALNFVYSYGKDSEVDEKLIRELHQLLTEALTEDILPKKQRGIYKDIANDVVERDLATGKEKVWFRTTPPGVQTEAAMSDLIERYRSASQNQMQPLLKIAMFIVHFLAIHPFRDGNGRLSRLLTICLMIKEYDWCRYVSHEKFIEDNKERYYLSLRHTQQSFHVPPLDYDPWITFFLEIVTRQTVYLDQQLQKLSSARDWTGLKANELKVCHLLEEQGRMSSAELNESLNMSKDGLKKLLKRLCDQGIIERVGAGPSTKYSLN